MITSLILFDTTATFWTRLGVGKDPVGSFRLVTAFLVPLCKILTATRGVRFLTAQDTEIGRTLVATSNVALHFCRGRIGGTSDLFTAFPRTPPCQRVAFDVATDLVRLELLQIFRGGLADFDLRHHFITARLGTCLHDAAMSFLLDGIGAEIVPAIHTEFMATRHGQFLVFSSLECVVADRADIVVTAGGFERLGLSLTTGTSMVHTVLFHHSLRVVVKDLHQPFLRPVVSPKKNSGGIVWNIKDLRHIFQTLFHFRN
mmetsp:Transcript_5810/g.14167  ORF Transcript_5810/g.14167 Transcript_5810/m.14167 type:complete len:258 (+) Transcript_5810:779-1552(+)